MNVMSRPSNNNGFTLLELLIAIALLSMILAVLFNSLYTISRSWNSGYSQVTANDGYRQVSQFIKRYLSQSLAIKWQEDNKLKLIFSGDEQEITFVSPLPAHRGGGGLAIIRLNLSQQQDKQLLMHYEYASPAEIETILDAGPRNQTTLMENIEQMEFTYYGAKKLDEPVDWHDNWQDAELMPSLVRMQITHSDGISAWPEMLIPLYSQPLTVFPEFVIKSRLVK